MTRFGYRYIIDYLLLNGVEVSAKEERKNEGLIDEDLNKELIKDLITIIYSFSGKYYSYRSAKFREIRNCVKLAVEKEEKSC